MRANDTMEKDWEEMDHNVSKTSGKSGPDAVRTDDKWGRKGNGKKKKKLSNGWNWECI